MCCTTLQQTAWISFARASAEKIFLSQCPSSAKGDRRRCCDAVEAGTRAGAANAAPTATFLPRLPGSCTKGATAQGICVGNCTIPVNARDPASPISLSLGASVSEGVGSPRRHGRIDRRTMQRRARGQGEASPVYRV